MVPALLDKGTVRTRLQEAVGAGGWNVLEVRSVTLVQERPGKRRVCRYSVLADRAGREQEVTWYGKEFAGRKADKVWWALQRLHARSSGIIVPGPVGYSRRARLVITASVEGPSLEALLEGESPSLEPALRRIGAGLAEIHELGAELAASHSRPPMPDHGPHEEALVLQAAAARASASSLDPTLVRRLCDDVEWTTRALESEPPGTTRWLHRDLHPGQIRFVSEPDDAIAVMDWDETAFGEAELDVGNLAAHFFLSDLQRRGRIGSATERVEWLVQGHAAVRAARPERLATYTASALLRLASLERLAAPCRSRIPWPELAGGLVECAEQELSRA